MTKVIKMYGTKDFDSFFLTNRSKKFSLFPKKFDTCCHPEQMLNQRFWNISTYCLATEWDQLYLDVRLYFGNHVPCSDAPDMFQKVQGSISFELLLIKEAERRERLSKWMQALVLSRLHPFLNGTWE